MANKVIISADSTCDIGPELQKKYNVQLLNWRIELEGKEYIDNVEIVPDDLYTAWRERKALPKSSGATPYDLKNHFTPWLEQGYDVVHIDLGSGISCAYQNCCAIAQEMPGVYPVDSQNLSGGFGHLVIKAAELAEQGMSAPEIKDALENMCSRVHTSFLLDTLEFMKAGGRCSAVAAFGANLLKLKPCIEVDNTNGAKMHVGKKYRGTMENCLKQYIQEKLEGRDDIILDRVFITHSGSPASDVELVKQEVAKYQNFAEVYETRANCVISTHCGPRTLGVLFVTKE